MKIRLCKVPVLNLNYFNFCFSSKNVILVISPASLQSEWSKFEMLMAVDDSHQRNNVCLVPVLLGGVKVDDLPPPLRPLTCIELMDDFRNTDDIIQAISSMLFYNHDKCKI